MKLITEPDAIKALRKAILNLMDGLPTTIIDGEECIADNRLCNAYLEANKAVSNALRKIQSWHTDDPEESGEYLITWEVTRFGKTYRKLAIAEWEAPITNDEGDIVIESGAWILEDWLKDYDELSVVAWMPLPDAFEGEV